MSLYAVYCRAYQGCMRLASHVLPWREPSRLQGAGSLARLPALLRSQGWSRLLIVTGPTTSRIPRFQALLADLDAAGIAYFVYDRTVANPTVENVEAAYGIYRERGCDSILAFGGGSPMDCAKAVGVRVVRPNVPLGKMRGLLKVRRRLPPLVAVPTTAGTGSEVTVAAVISDPAKRDKYPINDLFLIPRYAVLDPELTVGLPPALTATTGLDALTHAVEAYIGGSNTKTTERAAIEATRLIVENLGAAYRDGSDVAVRGRLLEASYLAGVAFTRAYVGYVHAIAHSLGAFYGVPHGLANAVILPYVLEAYGAAAEKRLANLARASGSISSSTDEAVNASDDAAVAGAFIALLRELNAELGIAARLDGIVEADIPALVEHALREANPTYPVPRIWAEADMERLFRLIGGFETRRGE